MESNEIKRSIIREITKKARCPTALIKLVAKRKKDEDMVENELRDLLIDGALILGINWKIELPRVKHSVRTRNNFKNQGTNHLS